MAERAPLSERDPLWGRARALWEMDPTHTFGTVAQEIGRTKQRVAQVAEEEGWRRKAEPDRVIGAAVQKAVLSTQAMPVVSAGAPPAPAAAPASPPPAQQDAAAHGGAAGQQDQLSRQHLAVERAVVDEIAGMLTRHFNEWRVVGGLLQEGVSQRNHERMKMARTAAQALLLKQRGERLARGLDMNVGSAPPVPPNPGDSPGGSAQRVVVVYEERTANHGE